MKRNKGPYIDADYPEDSDVAHVYELYVPPSLRGQGVGTALFREFVDKLPGTVKRIRLKSIVYEGVDSMPFWKNLGFSEAFTGHLYGEIENTLVLGINGYANPMPEHIGPDDQFRHWIEGPEDAQHLDQNPQANRPMSNGMGM